MCRFKKEIEKTHKPKKEVKEATKMEPSEKIVEDKEQNKFKVDSTKSTVLRVPLALKLVMFY